MEGPCELGTQQKRKRGKGRHKALKEKGWSSLFEFDRYGGMDLMREASSRAESAHGSASALLYDQEPPRALQL